MANEQNNLQKNDPKDQARNLYFQTAFTQAQIAEIIGVSQKTISIWMNEGKWKLLKESAELAPAVLIDQMISELSEIHYNIASRAPGNRFATPQEAETRRKIMLSIKGLKDQQSTNVHGEVMINFVYYLRQIDINLANTIVKHVEKYLIGEKNW